MDDIVSISNITYKQVRPGLRVVAVDGAPIGVLRGNFATGFWAYTNDSTQLEGTFTFPEEAAEVLSLEVCMRAPSEVRAPTVRRLT